MNLCQFLVRQRVPVCTAKTYCTKISSAAESQKCERNDDDTFASRVTNIIKIATKSAKPLKIDNYKPRVEYTGFLRNTTWHYIRPDPDAIISSSFPSVNSQRLSRKEVLNDLKLLPRKKYCLLMGFSGTNYTGMQYNPNVPTIEDCLFTAMYKNALVTERNVKMPFTIDFQRGSRTDRGVSAARQCCSLLLPPNVDVDTLNCDLPDDIRVFGVQRVTPTFDARLNCEARTYSYTLPTIAFANYNDQSVMADYRLPAEQLQKVNQVLQIFAGNTNFHNFTTDKQHFDRSSIRNIHSIACGEPFVENGVEFARIIVKGQSFMLHQIRKMMGFSMAVIREIIPYEMLQRALTKENFNVPTAPGLGLVLERLHFDKFNRKFGCVHGNVEFDKYETEIEQFRRIQIDPIIIRTEIQEQEMVNWLEFLVNHSYDDYTPIDDETFDDSWGEDPEFWKKVKK